MWFSSASARVKCLLQSWPLITESCSFYQQCCFIFIFVYMFDSKVTLEHLIWQEAELTAYNRRVSVRSKTACYIRPWSACRELLRYAHQVVKMSLLTALFFKLTPDFVTSWKCSAFFAYTGIRASDRRQTFSLHALQKAWVKLSHIRSESEVVTEHYLYCTYGLYTKKLTCHLNCILWLN